MTTMPLTCWDRTHGHLHVHAAGNAELVRIDMYHDPNDTVALVDPTELLAELTTARNEIADLSDQVERSRNETVHDRIREHRTRRVERWLESRPIVATVYRLTRGAVPGWWAASCGDDQYEHYPSHAQAVEVAHAMATLAAVKRGPQPREAT